jgi:hypothetical protein
MGAGSQQPANATDVKADAVIAATGMRYTDKRLPCGINFDKLRGGMTSKGTLRGRKKTARIQKITPLLCHCPISARLPMGCAENS